MWLQIIGIFVIVALLCLIDFPLLWKAKSTKDIAVYVIILTAALVLAMSKILKWEIPSPLYIIRWLCKPLSSLISMLQ